MRGATPAFGGRHACHCYALGPLDNHSASLFLALDWPSCCLLLSDPHRTMQQLQRCRARDMVSTTRCVPAARRTPGERWPRIAQRRSVDCSIPNVPDPPTPQCLQAVPLAASWPQRSPRCVSATLSAIHCDPRRLPHSSCRYSPMPYHATGWIQACVADDSGRQRVPVRRQQAGVMP